MLRLHFWIPTVCSNMEMAEKLSLATTDPAFSGSGADRNDRFDDPAAARIRVGMGLMILMSRRLELTRQMQIPTTMA